MATTTGVVDRYAHSGYHILDRPVIDPALVAAARRGMDEVRAGRYDTGCAPEASSWNPGDDPHRLCKIELPHRANRAIADLIRAPQIGEWVAALTGARMVQVWWVQLLYKPPSSPEGAAATRVGWHRDYHYWEMHFTDDSELLTAWCALEDVAPESGPMLFVPGSHRWATTDGGDFFSQDIEAGAFAVPPGETWHEVPAVMPAGAFSLHHVLTLHGSGHNTSHHPRCSVALHMRTDRSRLRTGARSGLLKYIDDEELNPIIYGERIAAAF